jgi:hypothetical protein
MQWAPMTSTTRPRANADVYVVQTATMVSSIVCLAAVYIEGRISTRALSSSRASRAPTHNSFAACQRLAHTDLPSHGCHVVARPATMWAAAGALIGQTASTPAVFRQDGELRMEPTARGRAASGRFKLDAQRGLPTIPTHLSPTGDTAPPRCTTRPMHTTSDPYFGKKIAGGLVSRQALSCSTSATTTISS